MTEARENCVTARPLREAPSAKAPPSPQFLGVKKMMDTPSGVLKPLVLH